jgi:hypothetical protein
MSPAVFEVGTCRLTYEAFKVFHITIVVIDFSGYYVRFYLWNRCYN